MDMKHILKRLALVLLPVYVWLAFFVAFEPNNYFGLKAAAGSSQPVARVRAYQKQPGRNLILGDSRLAHLDEALIAEVCGEEWQNLAFGGASLRETLDLAQYILDSGAPVDRMVLGVSFYVLNAGYDTDRFAALEETLKNPLAYCLNLEYNVNALTGFQNWLLHTPDTAETGEWGPQDYFDADGAPIPVHRILYDYIDLISPRCKDWTLNEQQLERIAHLAGQCRARGIRLALVLPPMAGIVREQVGVPFGIEAEMESAVLPQLRAWAAEYGFALLDYEWGGSCITDDDIQFYDGFHLDEAHGLPQWTRQLFADVYREEGGAGPINPRFAQTAFE